MKKANYLETLYEQADEVVGKIEYLISAFNEGSVIYNVVTEDYPTLEAFIGKSVLETSDGRPGYIAHGQDGESVFCQQYSDNKQIQTYIKDGKITEYKFLIVDKNIDTSVKKLQAIKRLTGELISTQIEIDKLEMED